MKASRKDFEAIALALRLNLEYQTNGKLVLAHRTLCNTIAATLKTSNPAFDYVKFITACGH